jgi:hypothetical protein
MQRPNAPQLALLVVLLLAVSTCTNDKQASDTLTGPQLPDLVVTGIEVSQGTQNLANDLPLVANRWTIVRVYVDDANDRGAQQVTARLLGFRLCPAWDARPFSGSFRSAADALESERSDHGAPPAPAAPFWKTRSGSTCPSRGGSFRERCKSWRRSMATDRSRKPYPITTPRRAWSRSRRLTCCACARFPSIFIKIGTKICPRCCTNAMHPTSGGFS